MKVLFAIGDPAPKIASPVHGGSATHIWCLIKAFQETGNEVVTVIGDKTGSAENLKSELTELKYTNFKNQLPSRLTSILKPLYKIGYNWKFYRSKYQFFQTERPEFIFERYYHFHLGCSQIAKALKIPYIVQICSHIESIKFFDRPYFLSMAAHIQRKVAERADAIVTLSDVSRNHFMKKGISSKKIHVIPCGVDSFIFDPRNVKENIRSRYELDGKLVIGYVGNMYGYHGVELLLPIARELIRSNDAVHFLLVGPFNESFVKTLSDKKLEPYFTLTGGVPFNAVPAHISAMDICIMPHSNPHGSPIKIFEYGAMGKPVVAPRFKPIESIIQDGINGLLFKPEDINDTVNKLKLLLADYRLRSQFGTQLQERVRANFTWQNNARKILEIYRSIVS